MPITTMIFVDMDWGSPTFDAECWCVVLKRELDKGETPGFVFFVAGLRP